MVVRQRDELRQRDRLLSLLRCQAHLFKNPMLLLVRHVATRALDALDHILPRNLVDLCVEFEATQRAEGEAVILREERLRAAIAL